jgi:hypothetical protein
LLPPLTAAFLLWVKQQFCNVMFCLTRLRTIC